MVKVYLGNNDTFTVQDSCTVYGNIGHQHVKVLGFPDVSFDANIEEITLDMSSSEYAYKCNGTTTVISSNGLTVCEFSSMNQPVKVNYLNGSAVLEIKGLNNTTLNGVKLPATVTSINPIIDEVDLRKYIPFNENQYQSNACVGFAVTNALEVMLKGKINLSAQFAYYNGRLLDNIQGRDIGSNISKVYKGLVEYGVCKEEFCSFDYNSITTKPSQTAYAKAAQRKVNEYKALNYKSPTLIDDMKNLLIQEIPSVIIMDLSRDMIDLYYNNNMDNHNPRPISTDNPKALNISHAMTVVGFNKRGFIVENSWGRNFGDNGCFLLPYDTFLADIVPNVFYVEEFKQ